MDDPTSRRARHPSAAAAKHAILRAWAPLMRSFLAFVAIRFCMAVACYDGPGTAAGECALIEAAIRDRCGPDVDISCEYVTHCSSCCSIWPEEDTLRCEDRLRAAATCQDALAVRCSIACEEWAE